MILDIDLVEFLNWATNGNHRICIYIREPLVSAIRNDDPESKTCIVEDYPSDDGKKFTHRVKWKDYDECIKQSDRERIEFLNRPINTPIKRKKKRLLSVNDFCDAFESGDIDL